MHDQNKASETARFLGPNRSLTKTVTKDAVIGNVKAKSKPKPKMARSALTRRSIVKITMCRRKQSTGGVTAPTVLALSPAVRTPARAMTPITANMLPAVRWLMSWSVTNVTR